MLIKVDKREKLPLRRKKIDENKNLNSNFRADMWVSTHIIS